ncbi:MAG: protein translocase subunit SecF [Bacteroidota bacterium]
MINFFRIRKFTYLISFTSIFVLGGGLIYKQGGLSFGLEFTGGRSFIVSFQESPKIDTIKDQLKTAFDNQSTNVKTYGSTNVLRITTSYLLGQNDPQTNQAVQKILIDTLNKALPPKHHKATKQNNNRFEILSSSIIAPTVAGEETNASIIASILSLLMILAYLLLRFRKFQYSLATVMALIHDGLAVITAFVIARQFGIRYEINSYIVGSILAGIGYSCNNSVVIITYFINLLKESQIRDLKEVGNLAITQTLSRTMITSGTTFIAVACLYIFGGEALRAFSFSMIVSIIAGTYSSLFVIPLAYDLDRLTQKMRFAR